MRKPNLRSLMTRKAAIAAAGGVAVVALSGTAAFAYWTTTGSGTGSAATGTSATVTITQVGAVSGLTPGGTAQPVDFKITNPMTTKQYVGSVTVSITSVTKADGSASGCAATNFTVVQPTAINRELANGDTTFSPSGATIALNDDPANNQDNCKNVTVNLGFASN